jgi:hypothetical protein
MHLVKLSLLAKKINSELISPTINFDKFLSDENSDHLILLQNLINSTTNQKKKYEKIKQKYFESCQLAAKQEKKLLAVMSKKNSTENLISSQNEILTQLRVDSENQCQIYKNELKITNELYEGNNKKYFPLINTIKDNEEKRINFLSFYLEKFITVLNEQKVSFDNMLNGLKEKEELNLNNKLNSLTVKLNEDIQLYQEKFNFLYKPGIRLPNEEIVLYAIWQLADLPDEGESHGLEDPKNDQDSSQGNTSENKKNNAVNPKTGASLSIGILVLLSIVGALVYKLSLKKSFFRKI